MEAERLEQSGGSTADTGLANAEPEAPGESCLNPNDPIDLERIVAFAEDNPESELHKCFEWDDLKAAHLFRLEQAKLIIESLEAVVEFETERSAKEATLS